MIYYDGYWEADLKTRQGYLSNRYQFQCNCQPCIKVQIKSNVVVLGFYSVNFLRSKIMIL